MIAFRSPVIGLNLRYKLLFVSSREVPSTYKHKQTACAAASEQYGHVTPHVVTAAGFLSTLSCEASVLILMLITSDRLVSVTRPFDRRQPSLRRATMLVAVLWLFAAVVAALPLCVETVDYFGEEFYGGNGVCLPLHLQKPFADVSGRRQGVCGGPSLVLSGDSDMRSTGCSFYRVAEYGNSHKMSRRM